MNRQKILDNEPIQTHDILIDLKRHTYQVGNLIIKTNQKCSCRSVRDFMNSLQILNKMNLIRLDKKLHIFCMRNIYNRLISGYLDLYAYESDYNTYIINKISNKKIIKNFEMFVEEIYNNSNKNIDKKHFNTQTDNYNLLREELNFKVDHIFNSEDIN